LNLWALDDIGLKNLFALTSKAWVHGYYYKPRIDIGLLEEHSEGIACGSGGPNSWVMRPLIEGSRLEAKERAACLRQTFGDRFYLEIRPHHILTQDTVNRFAIDLASQGLGTLL